MSTGFILFLLMAGLEIVLAVVSCRKKSSKKGWRRNRLFVRVSQIVIAAAAALLPLGQKWRFTGLLVTLAILAFIAALALIVRRKKAEGEMPRSKAIVSCVLSIIMILFALVPAFVFTGYKGLPVSGGYKVMEASAILVDSSRTDPYKSDGSFREVPAHFYYPEASDGACFPLVVFSHGAFGYYQSNTSTYMELASNGYVVVSLDHPHHAFFTKDTKGGTVLVDMDFFNTALNLNAETDVNEQYALYTEWMALRTADMNFVLDEVKAAAISGAAGAGWSVSGDKAEKLLCALRMIDISRIGLMGHSMGGAAAVELGREREDISAAVDIDGTMLGEYTGVAQGKLTVREDPYTVPVLEFNNWESYNDNKEASLQDRVNPNTVLIANASCGFTTTISGTKHMDFTDLPLLSPLLGNMLGSGERNSEEVMNTVNSLVLEFFNCYLKGEGVFTVKDIY